MFRRRCRARLWWERRHVGKRGEQVVGFVEEIDFGVAFTPCGGEKDPGLAAGAEGDVGCEAGAAAGFLHDCGGGGGVAELDPSQADAGWIAGMAQALNGFEFRRIEINGTCVGRLCGLAGGVEQVLEQLDHVRGGGIDAAAGAGGFS
jgi:hypothetical protein